MPVGIFEHFFISSKASPGVSHLHQETAHTQAFNAQDGSCTVQLPLLKAVLLQVDVGSPLLDS